MTTGNGSWPGESLLRRKGWIKTQISCLLSDLHQSPSAGILLLVSQLLEELMAVAPADFVVTPLCWLPAARGGCQSLGHCPQSHVAAPSLYPEKRGLVWRNACFLSNNMFSNTFIFPVETCDSCIWFCKQIKST